MLTDALRWARSQADGEPENKQVVEEWNNADKEDIEEEARNGNKVKDKDNETSPSTTREASQNEAA